MKPLLYWNNGAEKLVQMKKKPASMKIINLGISPQGQDTEAVVQRTVPHAGR